LENIEEPAVPVKAPRKSKKKVVSANVETAVVPDTPREFDAQKVAAAIPKEKRELSLLATYAELANRLPLGVEGFKYFYWCIWRKDLQPYAAETWVPAFASGDWTILECFRGAGKTADMTVSYNAYTLGKEPWTFNLVIAASDDTANKSTSLISEIVEHYEGWKLCFPSVVPDKERGWGAKGYFVKDVDMINKDGYGKWLEKCGQDHSKDPSFVGAGIGSADPVGMHPKRIFIDDIHDIKNSAFPKDRANVVATVRANIMPTISKPGKAKPFIGIACTPWDKDDAYHILFNTGLFKRITTPILTFAEEGKYEFEDKKCNLTWDSPQGYDLKKVKDLRKGVSKSEFARMYLCDLEAAKNKMYKWYSYPEKDIDWNLPMGGGVDYASVYLPTTSHEGGRSYFAMGYILMQPNGSAIIADGILEQCTQAAAESYVIRAQNTYPSWNHTVVESDGIGAQFIQLLQRNRDMKIVPMRTSEVFRGSKESRQYEVLSPLFERAVLRVSEASTPFLDCLRSYLENYPNLDRHAPEWDVADAVLWSTMVFPQLSSQASILADSPIGFRKERVPSVWNQLGRS
jgi:hypothetical protein